MVVIIIGITHTTVVNICISVNNCLLCVRVLVYAHLSGKQRKTDVRKFEKA